MSNVKVSEWVSKVRDLVDVPFMHQGRTRLGLDCVGVLLCAAEELGIEDSRFKTLTGYRELPSKTYMSDNIVNFLDEIPYNRLQPLYSQVRLGDVLALRIDNKRVPRHSAVFTGIRENLGYMVHSDMGARRVVETMICPTVWVPKIHSIWRPNQLVEDM